MIITNLGQRSLSTASSGSAIGGDADTRGSGPLAGPGGKGGMRGPLSGPPGAGPLSGSNPGGVQQKAPVDDPNAILVATIVEVDPWAPATFKTGLPLFEGFRGELPVRTRWSSLKAPFTMASTTGFSKSDKLEVAAAFRLSPDQTQKQGLLPSVSRRYVAEHAKVFKGPKPPTDKVLGLAAWAIEHGLLDKYTELMDALTEKSDPAVAAYQELKTKLKENLPSPSEEKLTKLVGSFDKTKTTHFVVYYKPVEKDEQGVKSKLDKLEDSFRAYYYWFALKGQKLPLPTQLLTVVLAPDETEFKKLTNSLNAGPQVADAFYSRRDNISVLSALPLDQYYFQIAKKSETLLSNNFKKSDLLVGKGIPAGTDEMAPSATA